jgi:hypothetical protein
VSDYQVIDKSTRMEIDKYQVLINPIENSPSPTLVDNSQNALEGIATPCDNFLKTNIYEDAPPKLTFDETLADLEKKVVESLSFMKQAVSTCINPA